jgi:predicted DNA-binding protein (MmcQ/YjbR family)
MIGRKMFCMVDLERIPTSACFKVHEDEYEELSASPNFRPAPYFAKHNWVMVDDIGKLKKKEIENFLIQSYELVKAHLPKKIKASLGFPYS